MIVNTNTGEVINPRRLRSNNTYRGYYWVNHKHTHSYKPSGFTVATRVIGIARNFGGRVRRNSFSIFAIHAVFLFYVCLVSKLSNPDSYTYFTFTGLLQYFSSLSDTISGSFFVEFHQNMQSFGKFLVKLSDVRFDGVLEVFNPFLSFISPLTRATGFVISVMQFLFECFTLLFNFVYGIFTYFFVGLFM